ncbi:hypothetical protein GSN03_26405 (plasmid) [Bacillus nitratireducens]|nr:hypothetical protein GSN03_26405 [Bacillus nitratireducens]
MAGGCPFHYSYLHDPYGTYYGTTKIKGNVIFDIFHKDKQRKSYNGVMVGKPGAGNQPYSKRKPWIMQVKDILSVFLIL